jgi:hypothetical protein
MTFPALLALLVAAEAQAADGGQALHSEVSRLPFTPDSVKQVVVGVQPRIQACYEDRLAMNRRAPQGTLRTHWVITPGGLVKGARVSWQASTLKDRPLHDCVVAVLSTMEFPRPPDGKDHPVDFPFNLKAQP